MAGSTSTQLPSRSIVALLIGTACSLLTGCGTQEYLEHFPADTRLVCEGDASVLRAMRFTFDRDAITGRRAAAGEVMVTFGDAESSFDVPGRFTVPWTKDAAGPFGTIDITLAPGDILCNCRVAYSKSRQKFRSSRRTAGIGGC